jgi:hypothetical protein
MSKKITTILRIFTGALFLFSAYSKLAAPGLIEIILVDHGISGSRETAAILVRIIIGFELALGLLFFQPYSLKKIVIPAAFLFLSGFSIYLAYTGLILKDSQNCGCFGEMIKMSPVESLFKNIVLLGVVFYLFRRCEERRKKFIVPLLLIFSLTIVFIAIPPKSQKEFKFAQYTYFTGAGRVDLSNGAKLIAVLNTECDHCQKLAEEFYAMKKKNPDIPQILSLMYTEGSVSADSFRAVTKAEFPYRMIGMNEFLSLIGQSPPRIYWLQNGAVKEIWDKDFRDKIIACFPQK